MKDFYWIPWLKRAASIVLMLNLIVLENFAQNYLPVNLNAENTPANLVKLSWELHCDKCEDLEFVLCLRTGSNYTSDGDECPSPIVLTDVQYTWSSNYDYEFPDPISRYSTVLSSDLSKIILREPQIAICVGTNQSGPSISLLNSEFNCQEFINPGLIRSDQASINRIRNAIAVTLKWTAISHVSATRLIPYYRDRIVSEANRFAVAIQNRLRNYRDQFRLSGGDENARPDDVLEGEEMQPLIDQAQPARRILVGSEENPDGC